MKQGAGAILIKDGKVLLVKAGEGSGQITGTISFPGGNVDEGETVEQAARREFVEETGLEPIQLIDFPGSYVEAKLLLKNGEAEYSFKVFLVQDFKGTLKITSETEPFWVPIEEARKIQLLGKNNELLENAIKFLDIE